MFTPYTRRTSAAAIALLAAIGAANLSAQSTDLFNNTNVYGVVNNPTVQSGFSLSVPARITQIVTYHWNYGRGAFPGRITIRSTQTGQLFGPFQAQATPGQGGAPNVNWITNVNLTLTAGAYTVLDSDPSTWSRNAQSGNRGFLIVRGVLVGRTVIGGGGGSGSGSASSGSGGGAVSIPSPCHRTSGADVELAQPDCRGPVGTTLRFVVLRPMPAPLTGVVFKAGPIGAQWGLARPPATMAVEVLAGGAGLALVSGNGMSTGSVYQVVAPRSLCMAGRGQWTWDIYERRGGGVLQGDIDDFTVSGC